MNRRRLLFTGASALAGTIIYPAVAEAAMGARIDSPLRLLKFGVDVTGTISHWDSDSSDAIFHTTIVQGRHAASGKSGIVIAGSPKWDAFAHGALQPGKAVGHAVAVITNKDGSMETYKWTVPVVLR